MPQTDTADSALQRIIETGDAGTLRRHFDEAFWAGREEKPVWRHLYLALLRDDREMMKILILRGARPEEDDLARLAANAPDKYAARLDTLRRCGLAAAALAAANGIGAEESPTTPRKTLIDDMPREWLDVLRAFQQVEPEAVIAGGAVRDFLARRPVKDVDIFLPARFGKRKNKRLLQDAFAKSGLNVLKQEIGDFSVRREEAFPAPERKEKKTEGVLWSRSKRMSESWKVIAGHARTEYNIIFIEEASLPPQGDKPKPFHQRLLQNFDVGLCRAATDGVTIDTTVDFNYDLENKTLTLVRAEETTQDHLARLQRKYPDFTPCPKFAEAMKPKPAEYSYSYYY